MITGLIGINFETGEVVLNGDIPRDKIAIVLRQVLHDIEQDDKRMIKTDLSGYIKNEKHR